MPPIEAYSLLFFDTLIGTLIAPPHTAYVFDAMQIFGGYNLKLAAPIAALAVCLATFGNWWVGKLVVLAFSSKAEKKSLAEHAIPEENPSAKTIHWLRNVCLRHGYVFFVLVAAFPLAGQIVAVIGGALGIRLRMVTLPIIIGAFGYYFLLTFTGI